MALVWILIIRASIAAFVFEIKVVVRVDFHFYFRFWLASLSLATGRVSHVVRAAVNVFFVFFQKKNYP